MKKNILFVLLVIVSSLLCVVPVFAAELDIRPIVTVLFVNNGRTTYDSDLSKQTMEVINSKLVNYQRLDSQPILSKLTKSGILDITVAERGDIVKSLKGEKIDYVICAEIQPVRIDKWGAVFSEGIISTVTVNFRVIDLRQNKYLYTGTLTEQFENRATLTGTGSRVSTVAALSKICTKIGGILDTIMQIPVTPNKD